MLKLKALFFALVNSLLLFFLLVELTSAESVTVGLTVSGTPMTIESPLLISLNSVISNQNSQQATGKIPAIEVTDFRGEASGWTATVLSTILGIRGEYAKKKKISTGYYSTAEISDISVQGRYDGLNGVQNGDGGISGEFILEVMNIAGTPARPAIITITKPDGLTVNNAPVLNNNITFNGLIIYFPESRAVFDIKDRFGITVSAFPTNGLSITSSNLVSGGTLPSPTAGITLNPDEAVIRPQYSLPARNHTSVFADWGNGMGEFKFDDDLSWVIPPSALPGAYEAVLTYNLQ